MCNEPTAYLALITLTGGIIAGVLLSPVIWPKIKQAWQYVKDVGGW